jgi:hypothetical protein
MTAPGLPPPCVVRVYSARILLPLIVKKMEVAMAETQASDNVLPLNASFTLSDATATSTQRKVLGRGTYSAAQHDNTLTLSASGMLPNLNDRASLEPLPFLVYPPRYALFFYHQAIGLPAIKPFSVSVSFHVMEQLTAVSLQDVDGVQEVEVLQV